MPSGYYSDSSGQKKGLPVNAHSHVLDRTQFANIGISNDGSVTDPKPGQGIYFVGNPPTDPQPGKWYAGDAPTKAPVNETVLANWFEPTSWQPPSVDNPDGAAGTWRPTVPVSSVPGNVFSWENPSSFGVASETVDGYIRLQTTSDITVEWGREIYSGARPIAYGAAGTQSAGEYVYKITALCMALEAKTGALGPWKISVGMAFYQNNVVRDNVNAPLPSASKAIVWGVNEFDLTTNQETEQWTAIECYMNGRVPVSDIPLDAPLGGIKDWRDVAPDGPEDGYYFAPIIKITGADADVLIDSVQVFRGQNNLLVPGGIVTTNVTTDSLQTTQTLAAPTLSLIATPDSDIPLLPSTVVNDADETGNTEWFTAFNSTYSNQIPSVVNNNVEISWLGTAPASQRLSQGIPPTKHGITFEAGVEYIFRASASFIVGTSITGWGISVYTDEPGGIPVFQGTLDTPPSDGSVQNYEFSWTSDGQYADCYICIDAIASDWTLAAEVTTLLSFSTVYIGDAPGTIVGLGNPVEPSDPVTKGWFESQDLGGGNTNVVHSPDATEPEPVEDPAEPFENGSIWANPSAPISVPAMWTFVFGGTAQTLVEDGGWHDIPNYDRMEFTAPGPGALWMMGQVRVYFFEYQLQTRIYPEDGGSHVYFRDTSSLHDLDGADNTLSVETTGVPMCIAGFDAPGVTIFRLQAAVSSGAGAASQSPRVDRGNVWCIWVPGAVVLEETVMNPGGSNASQIYAPFARVRSANTWQPESALRLPGRETLDPTLTIVNVATSSSISGGGTQNGGSRTLTATVTSGAGTPVGSVQFKKNGSVFSTKTLSSGTATVSVSTSGSYSFSYLGGQTGSNNYQPSNSGSTTVTIRTLKTATTTKGLKWDGQYPESNGYVQSDYYNHKMRQGRYSSTWGNWKTMWGFDGVGGVSNLYDATKVELLNFRLDHTYYGGGADLDLGWHTSGSRPGTFTRGSGQENQGGYYRAPGTHTIDISSWAKSRVTRSDFGGIIVGSGSSGNLNHYCYNTGTNPSLRITYRYWG